MRTRLRAGLATFCVSLIAAQAARSPVIIIPGEPCDAVPLEPIDRGLAPVHMLQTVCMLGVQGSLPLRWRRA